MFLIVCLILYTFHFSVRINTVEKSMKNWAKEVIDECNSQLQQAIVGYKASVTDWLTDFIDRYMASYDASLGSAVDNDSDNDSDHGIIM